MLEEKAGWFVVNVRDTKWYGTPAFGKVAGFEDRENPFPQTGIRIYVLEPGKPNCRYHRESAQENVLVLAGECDLLVNGERRRLKTWDFVHFPPGVSHVCVGAGDGSCTLLMIGHRPEQNELFYPESAMAREHNAESPEPTSEPRVAYSDVESWSETTPPDWPDR